MRNASTDVRHLATSRLAVSMDNREFDPPVEHLDA